MPADRGYQLVVFDWDGTLLDSVASIVACTEHTLAELELPPPVPGAIRTALGLGLRETVEAFCPGCDQDTFNRIVEVYRRHWLTDFCHRPVLFDGVERALVELARSGRLLAVATAKGRRGLDLDLERTGLADRFAATRTVDEARSKPHPEMLLGLLDELGVGANETVMVGDTTHDLMMAHNAGVAAVAVTTGSHGRAALDAARPLACLEAVTELPGWLAGRPAPVGA